MPNFDLDKDKSLFSPLTFTIDEKTFTVENITQKMVDEVGESDSLAEQFAIFTGIDVEEANELNVLKLAKAIRLIMEAIGEPFDIELGEIGPAKKKPAEKGEAQEKNVSEPGQKK